MVFIIDIVLRAHFESPILTHCLDSILAFANSFLLQSGDNRLTIYGSSSVANTVLYHDELASKSTDQKAVIIDDQQSERLAIVTQTFRRNCLHWIEDCLKKADGVTEVPMIVDNDENQQQQQDQNQSLLSGSLAQALCLINAHRRDFARSRVLVFSLGPHLDADTYSCQYMQLSNLFFAAQKQSVLLDACSIAMLNRDAEESAPVAASMEDHFASSILQQGCDLTGGRYIRVFKTGSLLEHLFWCLTPTGADQRARYVLPPKHRTSPPAACFCHRKVLEIGYVCSVCVSIFCQYLPFCSTCNSNMFRANLKQISALRAITDEERV